VLSHFAFKLNLRLYTEKGGILKMTNGKEGRAVKTSGRGVVENEYSTEVEHPPPPPRVLVSIHPLVKSWSDRGGVVVVSGPAAGPRAQEGHVLHGRHQTERGRV
jgi:hypothetical protein